jgi:hypothetical protein
MPKPNKNNLPERVRLNLEFPQQIYNRLEEVQHRSHAASLTEVLRRSLALYDLVTEHIVGGGNVILVDGKGKQEKLKIL